MIEPIGVLFSGMAGNVNRGLLCSLFFFLLLSPPLFFLLTLSLSFFFSSLSFLFFSFPPHLPFLYNPAMESGERCDFSQLSLEWNSSQNRIWCIIALKYEIWWQQSWLFFFENWLTKLADSAQFKRMLMSCLEDWEPPGLLILYATDAISCLLNSATWSNQRVKMQSLMRLQTVPVNFQLPAQRFVIC